MDMIAKTAVKGGVSVCRGTPADPPTNMFVFPHHWESSLAPLAMDPSLDPQDAGDMNNRTEGGNT